MTMLFWGSALLLAYAFAGYPLLLEAQARLARRRGRAPVQAADTAWTPKVSVLLAVHNEAVVIERKIRNFLQLEYPEDRIDLYVVSDGCTDATETLTERCGSPRVRLLRQTERGGKTEALNRAAAEADGDIFVFTDANAMFRPDCIRRLVERLADPAIGLVSGVSVYVDASGAPSTGGVYRRYEEWIKARESDLFSIVGADGAAYAMRREFYVPLEPEYINDLLHPMQVLLVGGRAVSEPRAVVEEEADDADASVEMCRQTRIMAQSWLICLRMLPVLVREGHWGFAWQMLSHKMLRWATLPLLAVCAASALFLSSRGGAYAVAALAMGAGGLVALAGALGRGGLARTAWLFVVLHLAAVNGLVRLLRGHVFVTWTPRGS
ncbi:glycosyltransferase family 2 protein [Nitratidesulfovibrio liaohensis]|uniref:Glycosyltransferase family 2 protein n=1 Tax=Nitratidesulfovibrio liaohensis TaxID=2604158 RepID=A0ABY9R3R5_9BACT|nr:glycosyltransferase family 2 protein [Nitratidesulfovibrio liaohensis]WMW66242.1 glycosyltransferase family 2 protein [Nitratidesulfovibrio liaohensis]